MSLKIDWIIFVNSVLSNKFAVQLQDIEEVWEDPNDPNLTEIRMYNKREYTVVGTFAGVQQRIAEGT